MFFLSLLFGKLRAVKGGVLCKSYLAYTYHVPRARIAEEKKGRVDGKCVKIAEEKSKAFLRPLLIKIPRKEVDFISFGIDHKKITRIINIPKHKPAFCFCRSEEFMEV